MPNFDNKKNFAYGTISSPPSPTISGLSLTLNAGDGVKMPAVPFQATVAPADSEPTLTNSTIIRVTAKSTDTLTFSRTQEGSNNIDILAGMQLFNCHSIKALTDLENSLNYAADSGAADAYAVTLQPVPTAYTAGQVVLFKATNANTTTSTLNVNGLGVKTIKKYNGSNLEANDITAGAMIAVIYDGTNFQMLTTPYTRVPSSSPLTTPTLTSPIITGTLTHHPANQLRNGMFLNWATNGYGGGDAEDWVTANANLTPGFPAFTPALIETWTGVTATHAKGFWSLNGNFLDQSGNSYDLTQSNNPVDTSDGLMAQAKDFESSSSQSASIVDASCPNLEIAGSKTVIAFVKPESIGVTQVVASKFKNTVGGGYALSLYFDGTSLYPSFSCRGNTGDSSVSSRVQVQAGKWYALIGVYDSVNNKLKIWVNCVKEELTSSGATTDSNANFAVGCDFNGGADAAANFFDGLIQGVAVYDTAFSDVQVRKLLANTIMGGYKMRRSATNATSTQTVDEELLQLMLGNPATLAVEVYQDTASIAELELNDGTAATSTPSATTGSWLTLSAVKTAISSTAAAISAILRVKTANGNVWFRKARLTQTQAVLPFNHSGYDWGTYPMLLKLVGYAINGFTFLGRNPDKVRVTKSANQSINNNTETTVTWNLEDFDSNGLHDNATNNSRLTAQVSGFYNIIGNIAFAGHSDSGQRYVSLVYNGGTAIATDSLTNLTGVADVRHLEVSALYYLKAGDYVTITAEQESGGALNVQSARSWFSMVLID